MSVLMIVLTLRTAQNKTAPPVSEISLCDKDPRELCIVTFGAYDPGRMLINFQLPQEDYPAFHVKGMNRGNSYEYLCSTAENAPTSVYCIGPRTPLGEYIDLEVYSVADNFLLARGRIYVSAVVVWTPPGGTPGTGTAVVTITSGTPPLGTASPSPTQITGTPIFTTPFPSPTLITGTPLPGTAYPNP